MTEIIDLLPPVQKHQIELEIFFSTYFSESRQAETNKIVHGNSLVIEYSKDNKKIKSILINEEKVAKDSIIKEAHEAITKKIGSQVNTIVAFSRNVVNGYFKFENKFQILPVPQNAPKPTFSVASHPFYLEFLVEPSSHQQIYSYRSEKAARTIILLLNYILRSRIESKSHLASHEWALVEREGILKSEYLQLDYWSVTNDREKAVDGFTLCSEYSQIMLVESEEYYSTIGFFSDINEFVLPRNFEDSVTIYENLDEPKSELILRSSYWKQVAYKVFNNSWSLAYGALVTSIEVFFSNSKKRCPECNRPISDESCPSCHQPLVGPTRLFHEFIERYAPDFPQSSKKLLYDIRSSITHGDKLLPGDLFDTGFEFSAKNNEAFINWESLARIVQVAQINWLYANRL